MDPSSVDEGRYMSQNEDERAKTHYLGGHLWVIGKTEDPMKKTERALGREWFAITAFPLLVGTFGPIASVLNLCALVRPWRCELAPDGNDAGNNIVDPIWLIVVNVLSLVFGIVANVSILLVAGDDDGWRVKYDLQLIVVTIIGGIIASAILLALVVTAGVEFNLPSSPIFSFTEAFYYAILSAILYLVTSAFLVYTAYRLWHLSRQERAEVQFAKDHRRLMRLTVLFMAYILLGAAVFFHIEGWMYIDAVYWADVTILTIGFGDFRPSTNLGRALLIPYATGGIFILFLTVYCIPKLVFDRGGSMWETHLRDQERIKKVQQRKEQAHLKELVCRNPLLSEKAIGKIKSPANYPSTSKATTALESRLDEERETRKKDFLLMQDILKQSTRKRLFYSMILWGSCLLFLWLVGAACFWAFEHSQDWTYFDAVYFAFMAISVIGFGDIALLSDFGKAFFVPWSLIVVSTLTMLIAITVEAVGHPYVVARKKAIEREPLLNIPLNGKEGLSEANTSNGQRNHNNHDKNHLLVQTMKKVIVDHIKHQQINQRLDYSFEEWEYIFYLLGVLESPSEEDKESGERKRMIDWLHSKNPLNATEKLTEWILLTLVDKLEEELLDLRRTMGNTKVD